MGVGGWDSVRRLLREAVTQRDGGARPRLRGLVGCDAPCGPVACRRRRRRCCRRRRRQGTRGSSAVAHPGSIAAGEEAAVGDAGVRAGVVGVGVGVR